MNLRQGTHVIDIDGVQQRFHVHGSGPVCLVHSGGPGIAWEYLRMPLLERALTLVYLEPVGTGRSGRLADPRDYKLDVYARFVGGVIDHLGVPKVFLLGHSHGGFVAKHYALKHQDRLAGLILFDTTPVTGPDFQADVLANLAAFEQRFSDRPEAAAIRRSFEKGPTVADDVEYIDRLRRHLPAYFADYWANESEWEPLRAGLLAWSDPRHGEEPGPYDLRPELVSIAIPTLIVVGVHDFICGPRWARMLHDGIPGSELLVLENSGHMGHLEEPERFAAAVLEFAKVQNDRSGRILSAG